MCQRRLIDNADSLSSSSRRSVRISDGGGHGVGAGEIISVSGDGTGRGRAAITEIDAGAGEAAVNHSRSCRRGGDAERSAAAGRREQQISGRGDIADGIAHGRRHFVGDAGPAECLQVQRVRRRSEFRLAQIKTVLARGHVSQRH